MSHEYIFSIVTEVDLSGNTLVKHVETKENQCDKILK